MKKGYIIITLLILIFISVKNVSLGIKLNEMTDLSTALYDTLDTWVDKDGLSNAKIQVLETRDTRNFLSLRSNDSVVQELQLLVKSFSKELKRSGSATILKVETVHDTFFITKGVSEDGLSLLLPYKFKKKDEWIDCTLRINKDSTLFNLKTREEYSIVLGEDRQGLFKSRKPFVEVQSMNPYSTIKTVRSYQKTREDNKMSIGLSISYGMGLDLSAVPFIGIGLQYRLIKL